MTLYLGWATGDSGPESPVPSGPFGWSREAVEALNCIPIVFSRKHIDAGVRKCWKDYYNALCIQNPDEMQIKQRSNILFKLIEEMSRLLGYKKIISWEDIQNPYVPYGMINTINNSEIIQQGMASIVQTMNQNAQMPTTDCQQTFRESKVQ